MLESISNLYENCENITWRKACESASYILLLDICRRTIERWFLIYKDNNKSFPPNQRGIHTTTSNLNPFVICNNKNKNICNKIDNNDLYKKLKNGLYLI